MTILKSSAAKQEDSIDKRSVQAYNARHNSDGAAVFEPLRFFY
jgi:hypothetical protein